MNDTDHVVGFRETTRMIKQDKVSSIVLAEDTDQPMQNQILTLCKEYDIPVSTVKSKRKLGHFCGIERPAAVLAYLK